MLANLLFLEKVLVPSCAPDSFQPRPISGSVTKIAAEMMVFTSILNSGANRLKSILNRSPKQLQQQLQQVRVISEEGIGRFCDGGYPRFALGTNSVMSNTGL